jgi:hypothetical protein
MQKIDFSELADWCSKNGYELHDWVPSLASYERQLDIAVPGEPQALAELMDDLVNLEAVETDRLVWIRDWTVWNERSQEIGLAHLQLLVDSQVVSTKQTKGHIYVLQPSEWREAVALLTVPVLYGWDAHLFFRSGSALVNVSHGGSISVELPRGKNAETDRLQAWQKTPGQR